MAEILPILRKPLFNQSTYAYTNSVKWSFVSLQNQIWCNINFMKLVSYKTNSKVCQFGQTQWFRFCTLDLTDYNPRYALLVISCHRENQCRPRRSRGWHWFSRGDNFPSNPLMQSIIIIILLYWMLIQYIVYIKFGFTTIQVKWIFVFVSRTPYIQSLKRHQSESMVNRTHINSAKSIFFGISSSNNSRCHVPSRVRAWFHDSAGDNDLWMCHTCFIIKVNEHKIKLECMYTCTAID